MLSLKILNQTKNFTSYNLCQWKDIPKRWTLASVVDFILTGPLLTVVICAGVCGGILCCLTFWRSSTRLRIYCYLLALAVWDLFYILTSFFLYNLRTLVFLEITFFGRYVLAMPFVYYLSTVARTGSIWTVVIIALERHMALCHPLKLKIIDSQVRIIMMLSMVGVFAFLYNSFRYFETESDFCYEIDTKEYVPFLSGTSLRYNYSYWLFYRVIGGGLFYLVVPFVILVVLTIRIMIQIKQPGQLLPVNMINGQQLSDEENLQSFLRHSGSFKDKTNRWMHVAMITKFIICHTFPTILDIWELASPTISTRKAWLFMSHTSILLVTLNSSLNFYIYLLTSTKFRKDCRNSIRRMNNRNVYRQKPKSLQIV